MLKRQMKTCAAVVAVMCALILTACPERTSIAKLQRDARRYQDRDVAVAGRVTDAYGVFGRGVYEVDDGTGRLWVVTEQGVPSRGARVGAKGRLVQGATFGGRNYGLALLETDRRVR